MSAIRTLRQAAPTSWRTAARTLTTAIGSRTATFRVRPDFILIGGQRCGTTSLYRALEEHQQIVRPSFAKGINYFDLSYPRGLDWYLGHFPMAATVRRRVPAGRQPVVFEASGYYLYHPVAIERAARDLPKVKLVAMLRDPVERAYSAWKHESARGFDDLPFDEALAREDERLEGELEKIAADPGYESFSHRHHSYRRRGEYVGQIERVLEHVPADQLHLMYSEDFFERPSEEFARLSQFLGLGSQAGIVISQHNARPSGSMPTGPREQLTAHFLQERDRLEELVGRPAPWSRG